MSSPSIYALLVGVDRYDNNQQAPNLRGCVADTQAMYNFLTTRLEVPADRILWLTSTMDRTEALDHRATRDNIIRGWQQHLTQAGEGDHVFFHYSGHGAQAKTISPETEPDGLDETIVPADSRTPGVFDILDKELAALIAGVEANGAKVTCFMDCCHSGSGTRKTIDPAQDAPRTRLAAGDERDRPLDTVVTAPSGTRAASGPKGPSGILPLSQHILLSGCRDEELSHEYKSPETDQWQGATTYFLMKKLAGYQPGMTWGEVHDYVQSNVHAVYARQSPQLEGQGESEVFGGVGERTAPYVKVIEVDPQNATRIKLGAGVAIGLTEGSRVAIYAPGGDTAAFPLVNATADEVRVDHSLAKLDSPVTVELGSRAVVTAYGVGGTVYKVATDDAEIQLAINVAHSGQPSPFFDLVAASADDADMRVQVIDGHYSVQDGVGTQIVYDMPAATPEGASTVVGYLEHLARYRNTLALDNSLGDGILSGSVTLDVITGELYSVRDKKLRNWQSIRQAGNEATVTEGSRFQVVAKNNSSETLYMAIFMLQSDYGIAKVAPYKAKYEQVAPGAELISDVRATIERSDKRLTDSRETLKVIATKSPTEFDALALQSLNKPPKTPTRAAGNSSLSRLVNSGRVDGTRGLVIPEDDVDDEWTTSQLDVKVVTIDRAIDLPQDTEEIDAGTSLDITVKKPSGFWGRLLASTLGSVSRSAGDIDGGIPQPPGMTGMNADRYFVPVGMGAGGTRSADASPVVLGFDAEPAQLQSITPANPMTLEVSVENDPNIAGLLPIAYDGEFFYIAGGPAEATGTRAASSDGASDKRSMAVTVDFLPVPDVGDDAGEVGTRDLKRTVNLLLYKIMHNDLPPGLGVRQASLDAAGQPAYAPVTAEHVRAARRIVLLVHGFTSDTGWLVYHAWPWAKNRGYDLCLTFDYETFNTGFKENGRILYEQLAALGFGHNDGLKLDIFCHSMGTQVSRAMIELWGGEAFVDRVFMGGALNAGSALAKARKLLPWISTVILNGGAATVPPVVMAAWALKKITDLAVGVQDMDPDSAFFQEINGSAKTIKVPYFVQIGTNQPMGGQSVNWTRLFTKAGIMKGIDMGLDAVLGGDNDLAVGVASAKVVLNERYPNATVTVTSGNHFQYFVDSESKGILDGWVV